MPSSSSGGSTRVQRTEGRDAAAAPAAATTAPGPLASGSSALMMAGDPLEQTAQASTRRHHHQQHHDRSKETPRSTRTTTGTETMMMTTGRGGTGGPAATATARGPMARQERRLGVTTDYTDLSLHSASANGNIGLVKYALQNGQPVNSVLNGVLPLHAAASSGNEAVVKELLDHGADVDAPRLSRRYSNERTRSSGLAVGTTGSTALHFAAANGHTDIVALLLDHGANPTAQEKYGLTPEMMATQRGHFEAASLLRQAQLEQFDRDAATAASGSGAPSIRSIAKKGIHPQRSFDALAVKLQQHASQPHLPSSLSSTSHSPMHTGSTTSLHTLARSSDDRLGPAVVRRLTVPSHHPKDAHGLRRSNLPAVLEKASHPKSTLKQALGLAPSSAASTSSATGSRSRSSKRKTGDIGRSLGHSESRTSLQSTSMLGRNRSDSVIEDDEHDLADGKLSVTAGFGGAVDDDERRRRRSEELFRPSTSSSLGTMSFLDTRPGTAPFDKSSFHASEYTLPAHARPGTGAGGTARADQFYRPRQSSQLSGRTSFSSNTGPASPRVFVEEDEDASEGADPSRSAVSSPNSEVTRMSSLAERESRASGRNDTQATLSSQHDGAETPRPFGGQAGDDSTTAGPDRTESADGSHAPAVSRLSTQNNLHRAPAPRTTGVNNVKTVETRTSRSNSGASSYSGPGTMSSTYAPSISTAATSVRPASSASGSVSGSATTTKTTAAPVAGGHYKVHKSPLSPLYEGSTAPVVTTSAQAHTRVKHAERELLNYDPSESSSGGGGGGGNGGGGGGGVGGKPTSGHGGTTSLSKSTTTLSQKLAAYGQNLALERKLAAMEGKASKGVTPSAIGGHARQFKYETIGTSSSKAASLSSGSSGMTSGIVTSAPLETNHGGSSKPSVPQWGAIPRVDKLVPPASVHGQTPRTSQSAAVEAQQRDSGPIAAASRTSPPRTGTSPHHAKASSHGNGTTQSSTHAPIADGSGNTSKPVPTHGHVLGLNADAPRGPVSYVEALIPSNDKPSVLSTSGGGGGGSSKRSNGTQAGGGGGLSAGRGGGGGGGSSVTSAKDQLELDAIEQARMDQAVPKAIVTTATTTSLPPVVGGTLSSPPSVQGRGLTSGDHSRGKSGGGGFRRLFGR